MFLLYIGGETFKLVTYNIGSLVGTRIASLRRDRPELFTYLSKFDFILLQTADGETKQSSDFESVADTLVSLLNAQLPAGGQPFAHSFASFKVDATTTQRHLKHPSNLHILYRGGPAESGARLHLVSCVSQDYAGGDSSLLGCAFLISQPRRGSTDPAVMKKHPLIVANLDDTRGIEFLTNPLRDLPDNEVSVMKRLYGMLCLSLSESLPNLVETRSSTAEWCSRFPITAVFAGHWGDSVVKSFGGKGLLNGTFADFKSAMKAVEEQM